MGLKLMEQHAPTLSDMLLEFMNQPTNHQEICSLHHHQGQGPSLKTIVNQFAMSFFVEGTSGEELLINSKL